MHYNDYEDLGNSIDDLGSIYALKTQLSDGSVTKITTTADTSTTLYPVGVSSSDSTSLLSRSTITFERQRIVLSGDNTVSPGVAVLVGHSDYQIGLHVGSSGNRGIWDYGVGDWFIYRGSDDKYHFGTSTTGSAKIPIYLSSGTPTACNTMMSLTGDTFTGIAYAQTNTSYTTYQLRNIAFTTSTPSSLTNGYVCMVYS